jgi:DNA-binding transcriptional LysR family regulator
MRSPAPEQDESGLPPLREFAVLRAVIAHRTTSAAARALGVSQPAVSRALASLEERLDRSLFLREGGSLSPTPEAVRLSEGAHELIGGLRRLLRRAGPEEGAEQLQLLTTTTLAQGFLAPLLPPLMRDWPELRLQVEITTSAGVLTGVADGTADLGLLDQFAPHPSLVGEVIHQGAAQVALPPGHPLAGLGVIPLASLAAFPLIALPRRFRLRAALDRAFRDAGLRPQLVMEAATSAFAAEMVLRGVGIAVLNPFPLRESCAGLLFRPFLPDIRLETAVVVPSAMAPRPAVSRFTGHLRRALAGPDQPPTPTQETSP